LAIKEGTTIVITEEPASDIFSIASHLIHVKSEGVDISLNENRDSINLSEISALPSNITFTKTKDDNNRTDYSSIPSIEVKGLSFQYSPSQPIIFKDLQIAVKPGECLYITGPNGCGKTTLAKIIAGILKPRNGEVWINGINAGIEPIWKVARYVAYAFQNPDYQIFSTTVWNEVMFGPKSLGYSEQKSKTLTDSALRLFSLSSKKEYHPHDLNRSDRKRLGLASVYAMDTPTIILDEPTHFQSTQEKISIRQAIDESLIRGKTLIIITNLFDFIE
jgi:energy-coupling factor transport system ATP-binding protein